jgi:hypothetical protein
MLTKRVEKRLREILWDYCGIVDKEYTNQIISSLKLRLKIDSEVKRTDKLRRGNEGKARIK